MKNNRATLGCGFTLSAIILTVITCFFSTDAAIVVFFLHVGIFLFFLILGFFTGNEDGDSQKNTVLLIVGIVLSLIIVTAIVAIFSLKAALIVFLTLLGIIVITFLVGIFVAR